MNEGKLFIHNNTHTHTHTGECDRALAAQRTGAFTMATTLTWSLSAKLQSSPPPDGTGKKYWVITYCRNTKRPICKIMMNHFVWQYVTFLWSLVNSPRLHAFTLQQNVLPCLFTTQLCDKVVKMCGSAPPGILITHGWFIRIVCRHVWDSARPFVSNITVRKRHQSPFILKDLEP